MEAYTNLKRNLDLFGEKNKRVANGFLTAVHCIVIVNLLYFINDRWDHLNERIFAIKALLLAATGTVYFLSFVIFGDDYYEMTKLFRETSYKFPYKISSKRRNLIVHLENEMLRWDRLWRLVLRYYMSAIITFPGLIVTMKVVIFSADLQKTLKGFQSTPFPIYYPQFISRMSGVEWLMILSYVCGYAIQSILGFLAYYTGQLAYIGLVCGMKKVEYELKLLRLSLKEMTDFINKDDNETREISIHRFMQYFIRHHAYTFRSFKTVRQAVRWIVAMLSFSEAIYLCLSIYVILQTNEILVKRLEVFFCVIWALTLYVFCNCGERIRTEDKKQRIALYACSWIDKPRWFKNSLLIAITRSCTPMDLDSFGIFALNLSSFIKIMNTAYSYYNVLRKVNSV